MAESILYLFAVPLMYGLYMVIDIWAIKRLEKNDAENERLKRENTNLKAQLRARALDGANKED